MEIFRNIQSFRSWRKKKYGKIGFCPTMGALHEGHVSLIKKSKKYCDYTIVSIFINPLQFNDIDDLKNYPSNTENDLKIIEDYEVDAVFLPSDNIMYSKDSSTYVEEVRLSKNMESESRPKHFIGVTTVVAKLFNITQPTHAFFGEKDAHQLRIIKKMVKDLNYNIKIIPCRTIRETSGLAMSSRNNNLTTKDRDKAKIIKQSLDLAKIALDNGERSVDNIKKIIKFKIKSEPNMSLIYVSISNSQTLEEISHISGDNLLISIAAKLNNIRLIDNITYEFS